MKTLRLIIIASLLTGIVVFFYSCSSTEGTVAKVKSSAMVHSRSGAQLWGENCIRCHSIPSPASYNNTDWSTIGLHMKVRANLTDEESKKIFDFLKTAN